MGWSTQANGTRKHEYYSIQIKLNIFCLQFGKSSNHFKNNEQVKTNNRMTNGDLYVTFNKLDHKPM